MSANVLRSLHKSCKFMNVGSMKAGAVLSNRTNIMDFVVIDTDFRVDKGNGFCHKHIAPLMLPLRQKIYSNWDTLYGKETYRISHTKVTLSLTSMSSGSMSIAVGAALISIKQSASIYHFGSEKYHDLKKCSEG